MVDIMALTQYCDGEIFQVEINKLMDYNKLMNARTVAFISLVWSENVLSYAPHSLDHPVWVNLLGNVQMQKAIVMAQIALYAAVLVPGFSDMILGLRGLAVGIGGWLLALVGPIGCVTLCELCKLITKMQKQQYQQQLALRQQAEAQTVVKAISSRVLEPSAAKSARKVAAPTLNEEGVAPQRPATRRCPSLTPTRSRLSRLSLLRLSLTRRTAPPRPSFEHRGHQN